VVNFIKKIFKSNIVISTLTQFLGLLLQFYVIFFIIKRIETIDFAYVSYSIMVVGIFETILGAGLTQYIVYKKDLCVKELSEIFSLFIFLSIIFLSILLTVLIYLNTYSIEIFFSILFILLTIPFIAINRYMASFFQKELLFKKIFFSEAFSSILVLFVILILSFIFKHFLILFSLVYFLRVFFTSLYFLKYGKIPKVSFNVKSFKYYLNVKFIKEYSFFTFLKYFGSNIDLWLTSIFFNKYVFAQFSYSRKLYDNCLNILQIPIGKLVFPEILNSKYNNSQVKTIDKFVFAASNLYFFSFFLINTLPEYIFSNFFGLQWDDGIDYLKTFSYGLPFLFISILGGEVLKSYGEIRVLSKWAIFQIFLTVVIFSTSFFLSLDLLLKILIFLRSLSILIFFNFFKFECKNELKLLLKYKVLRNMVILFVIVFVMNFLSTNLKLYHYNTIFTTFTLVYILFLSHLFILKFNSYQ